MFNCQDTESMHKTAFHPSAVCSLSWHILFHNSLDKMLLSSKTMCSLRLFDFAIAQRQEGSRNVIVWVLCLELRTQSAEQRKVKFVFRHSFSSSFLPLTYFFFSVLYVLFLSFALFGEKPFERSISKSDQVKVWSEMSDLWWVIWCVYFVCCFLVYESSGADNECSDIPVLSQIRTSELVNSNQAESPCLCLRVCVFLTDAEKVCFSKK